jgi:hypothetical protein
MKAFASAVVVSCLFSSCASILTKHEIKNPFHHSYDLNYRNAIAEGATPERAHQMALAVAMEKDNHVREMREQAKERGTKNYYDAISKKLGVPTAKPSAEGKPELKWD